MNWFKEHWYFHDIVIVYRNRVQSLNDWFAGSAEGQVKWKFQVSGLGFWMDVQL